MPRQVEYEGRPGVWCCLSGLYGSHGLEAAQIAGYPARYVGGVLQVNAKANNKAPAGWVEASGYSQEMTPAEFEAAYPFLDARLVPYEDASPVTLENAQTAPPNEANRRPVPQWQASRDLLLAQGECPCGILRAMCDYHR